MQTYLIDASIFVFRAWFTIPDSMRDGEQNPVNAVYGYTRFLGDFLEQVEPDFVAAAFDVSLSTSFRNELYPDYKANREPAPPELKRQFELCRKITRALGVHECADTAYEADDLIGTLAVGMRNAGHSVTIVSRDKDLLQLLEEGDTFWDYAGKRRIRYREVQAAFGVRAEQVPDFLGLAGDAVDNIPGVGVSVPRRLPGCWHISTRWRICTRTWRAYRNCQYAGPPRWLRDSPGIANRLNSVASSPVSAVTPHWRPARPV